MKDFTGKWGPFYSDDLERSGKFLLYFYIHCAALMKQSYLLLIIIMLLVRIHLPTFFLILQIIKKILSLLRFSLPTLDFAAACTLYIKSLHRLPIRLTNTETPKLLKAWIAWRKPYY